MFFLKKTTNKKIRKDKCSLPKRTSCFPFCKASLTVETALVLPVFFFLMLAILSLNDGIRLAGDVLAGAQETAQQLGIYACALDLGVGEEAGAGQGAAALSVAYGTGAIRKRVRENTGLVKVSGFHLLKSTILEDNMIDLVVSYQLKPVIGIPGLGGIKIQQRARVRAWTGGKTGETGGGKAPEDGKQVYVTTTGSVYHRDRNCTHIRLSIHSGNLNQMEALRNEGGGKYYACSCYHGEGWVYYTDTGDRYHGSLSCSSLKRGVIPVSSSQVENYRPCSRCGGAG